MKLTRVRIKNFRSIEDSEVFSIDDLTCLVGKNEAGKTAILHALHALRPYGPVHTKFDITQEYPRRFVTKYDERHPSGTRAEVVWTEWELTTVSRAALEREFGGGVLTGNTVTVSKAYKEKGTTWTVPISEEKVVENLIVAYGPNAAEKQQFGSAASTAALAGILESISSKTPKQQELLDKVTKYRDKSAYLKGDLYTCLTQ